MMAWAWVLGLTALFISSLKLASAQNPCNWSDARVIEGKCMKIFKTVKSWNEAQMICEDQPGGGRLAELATTAQFEAAKTMSGTTRVWIGGVEFRTSHWKWRSGGTLGSFLPWHTNQPDNAGGYEDCLELNQFNALNDGYCLWQLAFICESAPPPPKPITSCKEWPDSVEMNGKCVKFFNVPATWNEARRKCEDLPGGGRLVMMTTLNEWNKERDMAHGATFWTGLLPIAHVTFRWQAREALGSFIQWDLYAPNNANYQEQCVAVVSTGKLNDISCLQEQQYMCETDFLPPPKLQCPNWQDSVTVDGQCMKLFKIPKSWNEAQAHCESQPGGGQLVEIYSAAEYDGVVRLADGFEVWIGGAEFTNGVWKWRSERPLGSFIPWGINQPDNLNTNEDCLEIAYSKTVNDLNCLRELAFICEPAPPKPAPLTSCSEWPGSVEVDGKCVKFHDTKLSWHQSRRHCEIQPVGGRLLQTETAYEWNRQKLEAINQDYWIGAVAIADKQLRWASGGEINTQFVEWTTYEPNNLWSKEECGHVTTSAKMNDVNCMTEKPFMCEAPLVRKEKTPCPEWNDAIRIEGKCMKIVNTRESWNDAQIKCQFQPGGGQLAELLTTAQFDAARSLAAGVRTWVGGVEFRLKDWKWRSGVTFGNHLAWDWGQPDNAGGYEDCAEINANKKLNDFRCIDPLVYICEPAPPKPVPIASCAAWEGSTDVNGKCIKHFGTLVTWNEARRSCEIQPGGGRLVEMLTLDEWNKTKAKANGNEFWIDAVQVGNKLWKWGLGENFKAFVEWAPNQPDNQFSKQDCGEVFATGLVNDANCQEEHTYMCEITPGGYKRIEYVETALSWTDAQEYCRKLGPGGNLVSMESREEFNKIISLAFGNKIWTGGYKDTKTGKWMWISGGVVSEDAVSWSWGEPDNSGRCIEMYSGGKIGDRDCAVTRPFICQRF